jgi:hypothetical protein
VIVRNTREERGGVRDANFTFRVVFNSNFLNAAIHCIYPGGFGDNSIFSWYNNDASSYIGWPFLKMRRYVLNDF